MILRLIFEMARDTSRFKSRVRYFYSKLRKTNEIFYSTIFVVDRVEKFQGTLETLKKLRARTLQ